jgi:hypothetical protein
MKFAVLIAAIFLAGSAQAQAVSCVGQECDITSSQPLTIDAPGVLMVGGVDGSGIVRQIQTDSKGYVICSHEAPSPRPPHADAKIVPGTPISVIEGQVVLGIWAPPVDAQGFIICSRESK